MEEQIIEVEYNKELVEEYKENYIMEEEGIGAEDDIQPYDPQDTFNEVPLSEMIEEGEVVIHDKND